MSLDINHAFGSILAAYRNLEGLSQEDFEGAAHRTYVSDLERGLKSPTLEMISKLSERLKVHPTELVAQTFALLKTGGMGSLRPSVPYLQNKSSTADFFYTSSGKNFTPEQVEKSVILTNMTVSSLATIFYQVTDVHLFDVIDKKQIIFGSNFCL
jgi:transcriptional regulator with XRE-family HTH domain